MAVRMRLIQIDDSWRKDQLENIADTLIDDERYRPAQFAAMLASLSEPGPRIENEQVDDEPIE